MAEIRNASFLKMKIFSVKLYTLEFIFHILSLIIIIIHWLKWQKFSVTDKSYDTSKLTLNASDS